MIFDFHLHLYSQLPESPLLVCHAWHMLALSQQLLWPKFDPLGPVRPLASTQPLPRIARSNPTPLKADFSGWSPSILLNNVKEVAYIRTFLSTIQEPVITSTQDLRYLIGGRSLLKHLTS